MIARCILTLAAAAMLAACSEGTGPRRSTCSGNAGPPWPATVTGCWVQTGVDTYIELDLTQDGTTLTGTVRGRGLGGCGVSSEVTGTVVSSHVVLRFEGQTTDVTLSATADKLTSDTAPFVRRTWR